MDERHLTGLALIFVLGFAARWIAWRLRLPSILLLLLAGLLAGPFGGYLDPQELFGEALLPFVSLSVSLILFEGGLSLNIRELKEIGRVVTRLITVGVLVTWVLASLGAWLALRLELPLAILLGAVFVVTGPTVIIPLLRQVRPSERIRNVVKWEGILVDPVGAILAVLVYEAILTGGLSGEGGAGFVYAMATGAGVGVAFAALMVPLLYYRWVPQMLHNAFSLAMVFGAFTVSNHLEPESGLLATTVMGIALANQRIQDVRHIVEFKENLRVLLISTLFILLAARLSLDDLMGLGWGSLIYLAMLIFVIRPVTVWVSAAGSPLTGQERTFLAWMAPRGIVALAVASVFAERLVEAGMTQAERLAPITFGVVAGTVVVYGLAAFPLARRLGLAEPKPQGVLFVGAQGWACELALALQKEGFTIMMADSQWSNVAAARMKGLRTYFGNVLSEHALDEVDLHGIGKLLAMTPNAEANALAAVHFGETFGSRDAYQLATDEGKASRRRLELSDHLQGRTLFCGEATFQQLERLIAGGATVKTTRLSEEFDYAKFVAKYGEESILLFVVDRSRDEEKLLVCTVDAPIRPRPGQTVISLIAGDE